MQGYDLKPTSSYTRPHKFDGQMNAILYSFCIGTVVDKREYHVGKKGILKQKYKFLHLEIQTKVKTFREDIIIKERIVIRCQIISFCINL